MTQSSLLSQYKYFTSTCFVCSFIRHRLTWINTPHPLSFYCCLCSSSGIFHQLIRPISLTIHLPFQGATGTTA